MSIQFAQKSQKSLARRPGDGGFTLIEVVVAVALFSIVMVVCVAALLALINANRKAQALQSVMNNLSIALDDMARNVRMGTNYHCSEPINGTDPQDCTTDNGQNTAFAFEHYGGNSNTFDDQWIYRYDVAAKRILKSIDGGQAYYPITSPEVSIDSMKFYVIGTTVADEVQPRMVAVISGTAAAQHVKTKASFHIQVTAVQRSIDL